MTVYDDEQLYRTHMHRVCVREMAYEWARREENKFQLAGEPLKLYSWFTINYIIYIYIALRTTALGFRRN